MAVKYRETIGKPDPCVFSVVIPYCMDYPHIWFTVHDKIERLRTTFGDNWEIIVVENGSTGEHLRLVRRLMGFWGNQDALRPKQGDCFYGPPRRFAKKYIEVPFQLHSKPAINMGAWKAEGKYLNFQDSHTLVSDGFYEKAYEYMEAHPECGVLHASVSWSGWNPHRRGYQYNMKLDDRFWGTWSAGKVSNTPYPVAASGWCSVVMRRDLFKHIGGFPSMLRQYGGGEPIMDLLVWMFGYEVHVHPDLHCYHFALTRSRGYRRNWKTFFRNVALTSYICGGLEQSEKILANAHKKHPGKYDEHERLYAEALKYGRMRREFIRTHAKYTLDEIRQLWKERGVFH